MKIRENILYLQWSVSAVNSCHLHICSEVLLLVSYCNLPSVKISLQIFLKILTHLLRRLFIFYLSVYPSFCLSFPSALHSREIWNNKKAIPLFLSDSWIYMCMNSMPNISCCSSSSVFSHGGSVTSNSSGLSLKLTNLTVHQKRLLLQQVLSRENNSFETIKILQTVFWAKWNVFSYTKLTTVLVVLSKLSQDNTF